MKFFKTLLATILGTFISFLLVLLVIFIIGVSSSSEPEPYIKDQSVLKISMSGPIPDRTSSNPFEEIFAPKDLSKLSLNSLEANLAKAVSDDRISGVLLKISGVSDSWSKLEEVHRLISTYRDSSNKFIYATTEDIGYTEKDYFLATAADSIFSVPESFFEFDGFYAQTSFYKKMFEDFGIEPEITRHGKFKSAVEPYFRESYSDENELQLRAILDTYNNVFVEKISDATGKTQEEINAMMNNAPSLSMKRAFESGLVHEAFYPNELHEMIKQKIGVEEDDELNLVSLGRYNKVSNESANVATTSSSNKIAILNASGMILPVAPEGFPGMEQQIITADKIKEDLEDIREDDNIKALVVRVNSPGGAGTTSDLIWNMLRETSKDIPVIASMGSVAASGGYYIAMAADTIVANPTTITGSIGVFNTKFNTRELFSEKIGITFDVIETHEHANWLNPQHHFTETEQRAFQATADQFYQTFIERIAASRELTTEEVDERGQGRVWTGADALEQNLVDVLGGLDKAVSLAAKAAGVEDYQIARYPGEKDIFELLYGSGQAKLKTFLGINHPYEDLLRPIQELFTLKSGQPMAFMPYRIEIK